MQWVASAVPTLADLQTGAGKLLIRALKSGPVPKHVGFIMDGNRRFAERAHIETIQAHSMGFDTLKNVCL